MARYIDADVLHIQMEDLYEHHIEMHNFSADGAVADCLDLLDNAPTADVVKVKYGHWVQNEKNIPKMKEFHKRGIGLSMANNSIFWTCSECGMWGTPHSKYCGECGAYMRGDK